MKRLLRPVLAIAAVFVYFLLWAQFGFLHLLVGRGLDVAQVQTAMAAMGITGLVASFASGALLRPVGGSTLLRIALALAAAVAVASLAAHSVPALTLCAGLVGGVTALATVSLASGLRAQVGGRHLGLAAGAGTGLAYAVANLPPVFAATPAVQATAVAALALAAALTPPTALAAADGDVGSPKSPSLAPRDARGTGFAAIVLGFLALVWLDSAAFLVIQETAGLRGPTWGTPLRLLIQGGVHLAAALAAGRAIDRGVFRPLLLAAYGLFVVAFRLLAGGVLVDLAGPLYAIGISFYSVALVAYPSAIPDGRGLVPARWRAAIVFGVAGWLGSALGVGMAQDLHRIPGWFLVAAAATLATGAALAHRAAVGSFVRRHAALLLTTALVVLLESLVGIGPTVLGDTATAADDPAATTAEDDVARGRAIYIAEGCIHCHSQYVRPGVDEARWGPARAIDREELPPLLGNRRQGPDLANVALRRPRMWQRIHLLDPWSVSPRSTMPSYAHLFSDRRGSDLLVYLDSLRPEAAP